MSNTASRNAPMNGGNPSGGAPPGTGSPARLESIAAPSGLPPGGAELAAAARRIALTPAQQKQIVRLAGVIGRADIALEAAKEASDTAQGNASAFVGYCAEEHGIMLGVDGWRFDQGTLAFVQESEVAGG